MNTNFIFDLDGVVIDSMPVHTEAWRVYLDRLGIDCGDIEARMHGRRNDDIVVEFIGADLTPEEVFAHGAAKERLYRDLMRPSLIARLVPGVVEFLEARNGSPIGLASNAEPANIDLVLDGAGLRQWFRVIVDGHQVDRPKPFPDIYLRAANLLGTAPSECIVFEDSPAGVAAAREAGARVVGVETHPADLRGVDLSIRDFRDPALKEWLKSVERRT
jgi:HAD superfamily hydrolase (TIGR01509 family)